MTINLGPFWKAGLKLLAGSWKTVRRWGVVSTVVLTLGLIDLTRVLMLRVHDHTIEASILILYWLLRRLREPQIRWLRLSWLTFWNFVVGFELCHHTLRSAEWGVTFSPMLCGLVGGGLVAAGISTLESVVEAHVASHGNMVLARQVVTLEAFDELAIAFTSLGQLVRFEVTYLAGPLAVLRDARVEIRNIELDLVHTLNRTGHLAAGEVYLPHGRHYACLKNDGPYAGIKLKVVVRTEE